MTIQKVKKFVQCLYFLLNLSFCDLLSKKPKEKMLKIPFEKVLVVKSEDPPVKGSAQKSISTNVKKIRIPSDWLIYEKPVDEPFVGRDSEDEPYKLVSNAFSLGNREFKLVRKILKFIKSRKIETLLEFIEKYLPNYYEVVVEWVKNKPKSGPNVEIAKKIEKETGVKDKDAMIFSFLIGYSKSSEERENELIDLIGDLPDSEPIHTSWREPVWPGKYVYIEDLSFPPEGYEIVIAAPRFLYAYSEKKQEVKGGKIIYKLKIFGDEDELVIGKSKSSKEDEGDGDDDGYFPEDMGDEEDGGNEDETQDKSGIEIDVDDEEGFVGSDEDEGVELEDDDIEEEPKSESQKAKEYIEFKNSDENEEDEDTQERGTELKTFTYEMPENIDALGVSLAKEAKLYFAKKNEVSAKDANLFFAKKTGVSAKEANLYFAKKTGVSAKEEMYSQKGIKTYMEYLDTVVQNKDYELLFNTTFTFYVVKASASGDSLAIYPVTYDTKTIVSRDLVPVEMNKTGRKIYIGENVPVRDHILDRIESKEQQNVVFGMVDGNSYLLTKEKKKKYSLRRIDSPDRIVRLFENKRELGKFMTDSKRIGHVYINGEFIYLTRGYFEFENKTIRSKVDEHPKLRDFVRRELISLFSPREIKTRDTKEEKGVAIWSFNSSNISDYTKSPLKTRDLFGTLKEPPSFQDYVNRTIVWTMMISTGVDEMESALQRRIPIEIGKRDSFKKEVYDSLSEFVEFERDVILGFNAHTTQVLVESMVILTKGLLRPGISLNNIEVILGEYDWKINEFRLVPILSDLIDETQNISTKLISKILDLCLVSSNPKIRSSWEKIPTSKTKTGISISFALKKNVFSQKANVKSIDDGISIVMNDGSSLTLQSNFLGDSKEKLTFSLNDLIIPKITINECLNVLFPQIPIKTSISRALDCVSPNTMEIIENKTKEILGNNRNIPVIVGLVNKKIVDSYVSIVESIINGMISSKGNYSLPRSNGIELVKKRMIGVKKMLEKSVTFRSDKDTLISSITTIMTSTGNDFIISTIPDVVRFLSKNNFDQAITLVQDTFPKNMENIASNIISTIGVNNEGEKTLRGKYRDLVGMIKEIAVAYVEKKEIFRPRKPVEVEKLTQQRRILPQEKEEVDSTIKTEIKFANDVIGLPDLERISHLEEDIKNMNTYISQLENVESRNKVLSDPITVWKEFCFWLDLKSGGVNFDGCFSDIKRVMLDKIFTKYKDSFLKQNKTKIVEDYKSFIQELQNQKEVEKPKENPEPKEKTPTITQVLTPYSFDVVQEKCDDLEEKIYRIAGGASAITRDYLNFACRPLLFLGELMEECKILTSKLENGDYDITNLVMRPEEFIPEIFLKPVYDLSYVLDSIKEIPTHPYFADDDTDFENRERILTTYIISVSQSESRGVGEFQELQKNPFTKILLQTTTKFLELNSSVFGGKLIHTDFIVLTEAIFKKEMFANEKKLLLRFREPKFAERINQAKKALRTIQSDSELNKKFVKGEGDPLAVLDSLINSETDALWNKFSVRVLFRRIPTFSQSYKSESYVSKLKRFVVPVEGVCREELKKTSLGDLVICYDARTDTFTCSNIYELSKTENSSGEVAKRVLKKRSTR